MRRAYAKPCAAKPYSAAVHIQKPTWTPLQYRHESASLGQQHASWVPISTMRPAVHLHADAVHSSVRVERRCRVAIPVLPFIHPGSSATLELMLSTSISSALALAYPKYRIVRLSGIGLPARCVDVPARQLHTRSPNARHGRWARVSALSMNAAGFGLRAAAITSGGGLRSHRRAYVVERRTG